MKVLIVEDQERLGQFLERGLKECTYTVSWVRTCKDALDALAESSYDVVVLDLGLPDGDGIDILRQWRASGFNEPVLILSARDSVEDRIKGLPIDLTSREYALLEIFMQNPGRILTRTLISEKIWASHYDVDTNLLDVYMSRLRAKLETSSAKPLFKTVRGVGYQLL